MQRHQPQRHPRIAVIQARGPVEQPSCAVFEVRSPEYLFSALDVEGVEPLGTISQPRLLLLAIMTLHRPGPSMGLAVAWVRQVAGRAVRGIVAGSVDSCYVCWSRISRPGIPYPAWSGLFSTAASWGVNCPSRREKDWAPGRPGNRDRCEPGGTGPPGGHEHVRGCQTHTVMQHVGRDGLLR